MTHDEVVAEMTAYMEAFVERPHPAFGGLPVCPFARKSRVEGRIKFVVRPLSSAREIADDVAGLPMGAAAEHDLVIFAHPDKSLPMADLAALAREVEAALGPSYYAFTGHPEDPYTVAGVPVRRDPVPNIQVVPVALIREARARLAGTPYYARWSREEMANDGIEVGNGGGDMDKKTKDVPWYVFGLLLFGSGLVLNQDRGGWFLLDVVGSVWCGIALLNVLKPLNPKDK